MRKGKKMSLLPRKNQQVPQIPRRKLPWETGLSSHRQMRIVPCGAGILWRASEMFSFIITVIIIKCPRGQLSTTDTQLNHDLDKDHHAVKAALCIYTENKSLLTQMTAQPLPRQVPPPQVTSALRPPPPNQTHYGEEQHLCPGPHLVCFPESPDPQQTVFSLHLYLCAGWNLQTTFS